MTLRAAVSAAYVTVAVTDLTGTIDQSAAIQAAHDAAKIAGYIDVFFPTGTYLVNATVNWSPYIRGFTNGQTIIQCSSTSMTSVFYISTRWGNSASQFTMRPIFEGAFRFQQTGANVNLAGFLLGDQTSGSGFGCASTTVAKGVEFFNFQYGAQFQHQAYILSFEDCFWNNCVDAFFTAASITNMGERIDFMNCVFSSCTNVALLNTGMGDCFFWGCSFDYCTNFGSTLAGSDLYFEQSHFEWSNTANTLLTMSASGNPMSVHINQCTFNMNQAQNAASLANPMIVSVGVSSFLNIANCIFILRNTQTATVTLVNCGAATGTIQGSANVFFGGAGTINNYVTNTGGGTVTLGPSMLINTYVGTATWTKPAFGTYAEVVLIGAGGGGGSGGSIVSGTASSGGGGGGGGVRVGGRFAFSQLFATVSVTPGTAGTAGAAATGAAGNAGGIGGNTTFGTFLTAYGGGGGQGGASAAASGGGGGAGVNAAGTSGAAGTGGTAGVGGGAGGSGAIGANPAFPDCGAGGGGGASGAAGTNGGTAYRGGPGGGAGGGLAAGPTAKNGGNGGIQAFANLTATGGAGAGPAGTATSSWDSAGGAGAGGASSAAGVGFAGGQGGLYGAGGGGGGSSISTQASGAGGAGSQGFALVISQ